MSFFWKENHNSCNIWEYLLSRWQWRILSENDRTAAITWYISNLSNIVLFRNSCSPVLFQRPFKYVRVFVKFFSPILAFVSSSILAWGIHGVQYYSHIRCSAWTELTHFDCVPSGHVSNANCMRMVGDKVKLNGLIVQKFNQSWAAVQYLELEH